MPRHSPQFWKRNVAVATQVALVFASVTVGQLSVPQTRPGAIGGLPWLLNVIVQSDSVYSTLVPVLKLADTPP